MPEIGETKKIPCAATASCREKKFTIWIYGWSNRRGWFWKCLNCKTEVYLL